jgi:Luciferase-like monooxygenase
LPYEWEYSGEEADHRVRGDMLDEALGVLTDLWTGEPVRHDGRHYRLAGTPGTAEADWKGQCYPPPTQHPRIPVWVGGTWVPERPGGRAMRRAARWDAAVPMRADGPWRVEDTAAVRCFLDSATSDGPDLVAPGETDAGTSGPVHAAHEGVGATWWAEAVHPWRYGLAPESGEGLDRMAERIAAGP